MEGFTHRSDADRELDALRARAYGRNADIGADPAALARLRELEAAHRGDVERRANVPTSGSAAGTDDPPTAAPGAADPAGDQPQPGKESSLRPFWQRATATRWSRLAWAAGALVLVGGITATALFMSAPRPEATLNAGAEADDEVRTLVTLEEAARLYEIDPSTLRAHGSYLGLDISSGVNAFDSPCLVAVHRPSRSLSEARCAPSEADLIMDVSSSGDGFLGFEGRAGDGIVRFILRGDRVEAYVHLMPGTD